MRVGALKVVASKAKQARSASGENMKTALTLIGIIALAMGLLWMGQGSGYISWPASSFMISQSQWIYYGGAIAVVGLILIVVARR
jgi:hypothetical protein